MKYMHHKFPLKPICTFIGWSDSHQTWCSLTFYHCLTTHKKSPAKLFHFLRNQHFSVSARISPTASDTWTCWHRIGSGGRYRGVQKTISLHKRFDDKYLKKDKIKSLIKICFNIKFNSIIFSWKTVAYSRNSDGIIWGTFFHFSVALDVWWLVQNG